jgi:hypothetical protein
MSPPTIEAHFMTHLHVRNSHFTGENMKKGVYLSATKLEVPAYARLQVNEHIKKF